MTVTMRDIAVIIDAPRTAAGAPGLQCLARNQRPAVAAALLLLTSP